MRVNSLEKIELQAKAWLEKTWTPALLGESYVAELRDCNVEHSRYSNKWNEIRAAHCELEKGGKRCTCDAIPEPLQDVRRKLGLACTKINALYDKEKQARLALYQPYYKMLIDARDAKLKYLKEH